VLELTPPGLPPPGKQGKRTEYPDDFTQLWRVYPKGDKYPAYQQFLAAKKANPGVLPLMLAALEWQTKQPRWTEEGGKYRKDTERWIKGRGWETEPAGAAQPDSKPVWFCNHAPKCTDGGACTRKTQRELRGEA
jgi:hypothetical protein